MSLSPTTLIHADSELLGVLGKVPDPRDPRGVRYPLGGVLAVAVCTVLAGARSAQHLRQLQALLARATLLPSAAEDFTDAALLYRMCRINGRTVRSMVDCLIAAVAVRSDVAVLHADRDFDALVVHTPLRSHPRGGLSRGS